MNIRSKVAVILLLLAVVLCPFAACAMSTGQTGQASHPCCPAPKSDHSSTQHSDCKCIAAQPSGPQFALTNGAPVAEAPVALATQAVIETAQAQVATPVPLSDQDVFITVHQFRI